MKAILVIFDSLNRHMLPPYGGDWIQAPNFNRLADHAVTFQNCYAGSMPCIPARRELHTGRYNFLHRGWGPLEPFDDSMPHILGERGVYTHLVSDHYHYWEDGGATYHNRYRTWEIVRGQEGDPWIGEVLDPDIPNSLKGQRGESWRQDWINRKHIHSEEDMPQAQTFNRGLEFIRANHQADGWLLQIETFDPHEPFFVPQKYKAIYPHPYHGPHFDWPDYKKIDQPQETVDHVRAEYAALVSMCDHYLGLVLDEMDALGLWEDTLLIVTTDHGYLLGEHGWWAKNRMPWYNQLINIPLFIWDPRANLSGQRRVSLVQTIDLAPTLLDFFGAHPTEFMQGIPLSETVSSDRSLRPAGLFGAFGRHVNVTDGRYVYMRAPTRTDNQPLFEYTLMPTRMKRMFSVDELHSLELSEAFKFTRGCRMLKIPAQDHLGERFAQQGHLLFDLYEDPRQERPIQNRQIEKRMIELMTALMASNEAPAEQYQRLGLPIDGVVRDQHLSI